MNVLEKILQEIEAEKKRQSEVCKDIVDTPGHRLYEKTVRMVDGIIRSHMDDRPDAGIEEKSILCTVGEDGVLTPYDDTYDVIIHCLSKEDQEETIKLLKDSNWIPVSKRLPEVPEGTEDVYCPEFNVTIKGASKATTLKYAPDGTWFDDSGEAYKVVAWKPLPGSYKPEEG